MIRWTRGLGGVIAAAALLTLSSPVWTQSRPSDDRGCGGNYSTATYTQVTLNPGGVSSGSYAGYGEMYIYNSTTSAGEYYYDQLACEGVRYANATIYPDKSLPFGSDDVVAQQTVWMSTTSTCDLNNPPGQSYFVIYH